MNLKKINLPIYGIASYRGDCPKESAEMKTFFNRLRRLYPDTYALTACHIKNESRRNIYQAQKDKAEGLTVGASDIIIPGCPSFCCELKQQNHTNSTISEKQIRYLEQAQKQGSFVCVALGFEAAWEAFEDWINLRIG